MPTDTAVSRALARKEALQREIARCQEEIKDIDTFVVLSARFGDIEEQPPEEPASDPQKEPEEQPSPEDADPYTAGNGMVTQDQFEADIRKVLIDNGRPMKRGQLINALHGRGLRVGGTDELKN